MYLSQKRDLSIKGRGVYNGKPTREWVDRDDVASPTVTTESIMATVIVDAKEGRDIMSNDIPNAFIQASLPNKPGEARVIMKVTGVLVDILVEVAPDVYSGFVVYEKGKKVLYLQVLQALYGMLISAMLWYMKFRADLESIGLFSTPTILVSPTGWYEASSRPFVSMLMTP